MEVTTHHTSERLFQAPYSLEVLPDTLRRGMWALAICGLLSVVCSFGLLMFIFSRFVTWRKHYKTYIGYVCCSAMI